jgi:hypothetical protein
LAGIAASLSSLTAVSNPSAKSSAWNNLAQIFIRMVSGLRTPAFWKVHRRILWRNLKWVALFGFGGVLLQMIFYETLGIWSWGYYGEILDGILLTLPFLLSAIFVKRFGAVGLTVLLSNLFFTGLQMETFTVAIFSELPFLVTRYNKYDYTLLFISTLLNGVGLFSYYAVAHDHFLPFDFIVKSIIVSFISPLIVQLVGRMTNRL